METIRVNMNPNPLDVQTIHASQNDTEARQWEFELHNNGELIDTSDVKEQLVFKAYKGGTEQLLPENTSTPTTSPFLGDIRYHQGLLTDQEFTYRQSPTEEDGLAKITDIKGNTLVWNQLVQNGNFADSSRWAVRGSATINSVANNVLTFTASAQGGGVYSNVSMVQTHKYLYAFEYQSSEQIAFNISGQSSVNYDASSSFKRVSAIIQWSATTGEWQFRILSNATSNFSAIKIKNVMLFDLTAMGLDSITTIEEFASLFPLPYYSYNQGSLLSFNGNGIKTVGKNLLNARTTYTDNGITFTNDNGVITINGTATANAYFTTDVNLRNGSYFISVFNDGINTNVHLTIRNESGAYPLDIAMSAKNRVASLNNDVNRFLIYVKNGTTLNNFVMKPMISFDSPEYYEPYTSSTLSLPISTYFPNGMDGVGDAYDELTNSGYAKRMGRIDLGSITYTRQESKISGVYFFVGAYNSIPNIKNRANSLVWNIKTPLYETVPSSRIYQGFAQNKTIGGYDAQTVRIRDDSFTDPMDFKNSLGGQYLVYELATPTETSFTTASIVTENAEIPLSNEDGTLIGKCTEELSAEPGFIDAKIKLTDGDGTCYSNKIQLHVERKPS